MGCLCCRDRHKPSDKETEQLPLLPSGIHLSQPEEIRKPIIRSQVKLESSWPDVGNSETSRVRTYELLDTAASAEGSCGNRLEGIRVVFGGAECCYRLEEERDSCVVKAENRDTRKKCWIQISSQKPGKREQERKRRLKLLQSLDHPNLLKMSDVFQDDHHIYTVYEATEEGNEASLSTLTGGVSERLAAAIMQQVFAALSFCHSKGLALQCFTLRHIFLSAPFSEDCPAVKLLIPFEEKLPKDSPYIAPELKDKTHIGPVNDMWISGVILSSLIAGQCVFKNMQASVISQRFRSAYNKWQEVSKPAKSLTLALIARNYAKRPSAEKCMQHAWVLGS